LVLSLALGVSLVGTGLVSTASPALAARRYVAPAQSVATVADFVVRGRLDRATQSLSVLQWFGPKLDKQELRIENLDELPTRVGEFKKLGELPATDHVIVFLHWTDQRAALAASASPTWVNPAAAIIYLTDSDEVRTYSQIISPGPLVITKAPVGRAALEKRLTQSMSKRKPPARPSLTADESKLLHGIISPWLNLRTGSVRSSKLGAQKADEVRTALASLAEEHKGLLRRRAFEALLVLANERGSPQPRRVACERELIGLAKKLGKEPLVPVLHEVCSRNSTSANKRSAAAVLKAIGGQPLLKGRDLLLNSMASEQTNVVTNAYWGLTYMGFEKEAKSAPRHKK
jgi:hypothetical protein